MKLSDFFRQFHVELFNSYLRYNLEWRQSHTVKSVRIRSFLSIFSLNRTEYGDLLCKSLYSVRMRENTDQKTLI